MPIKKHKVSWRHSYPIKQPNGKIKQYSYIGTKEVVTIDDLRSVDITLTVGELLSELARQD